MAIFYNPTTIYFLVTISLLFPKSAMAYIDPGSGSILIQALIAAFVGLAFTLKLYRRKLVDFLKRWLTHNKDEE